MSAKPPHPPTDFRVREQDMRDAWAVHRALLWMELLEPRLRDNPRWKLHRMDAYEDFHTLMAGVTGGR